jgi:hypothetical protein
MAITYKSAGAGVSTETSGAALSPANPATVDAGDILTLFTAYEGVTTAPSPDGTWTILAGPEDVGTASVVARCWLYGKIAAGTEDAAANALGSPAVTTQRCARVFSFAGRTSGTITELITVATPLTGDTDPTGPSVTTQAAGGLAAAFVYQHDNNTLETFAGASDTWTERGTVGGFIFALTPGGVIDLLTATPAADPGTVSGGAMTVTNDPWTVIGVAIDAAPSLPALAEKSVTDSCAILASEAEGVVVVLLSVADTCLVQASETSDLLRSYCVTDSLSITASETAYKLQEGIPIIIGTDTAAVTQVGKYADDSCAIQAAEASAPSAQIPPSESCAIQCSETALVQVGAFADDSCVVQVDEAVSIASTVVASDSCAVICTESVSIVSTVSAADSAGITVSEAVAVVITFTVTDSCAVQLTDSLAASASESQGDSCAVQCAESAAVLIAFSVTDSCAVIAADVGSQQLVEGDITSISASDSVAVQVSEALTMAASVSATDSAAVQTTDTTSIVSTVSASDSATIALTDTGSVTLFLTASDTCAVILSEVATQSADEVVQITAADDCAIQASEVAALTMALSATDACAGQAAEVAATTVTVGMADSVMAQLVEDLLASVSASAVDTLPNGLSETLRSDGTASYTDSCAVIADDVTIFAGEIIPGLTFTVTDSLTVELDELVAAIGIPVEEVAMQLIESVTLVQTEVQGFWGGGWIGEHVLIPYGEGQLLNKPRDLPRGDLTW